VVSIVLAMWETAQGREQCAVSHDNYIWYGLAHSREAALDFWVDSSLAYKTQFVQHINIT